jgi:hypothetical protein
MGTHTSQRPPAEVECEASDFMRFVRVIVSGSNRDRRFILNMDQTPVYFSMSSKKTLELIGEKTSLLFPLNHQLNLTEAHHNVLLQHLAANLVLLARAALATHLRPYDLNNNTTRIDGLAKRKGRGRHSGRGNKDGGGDFFSAGACAITLSAVKRGGTGAGASAGAAACGLGAGTLDFFWRFL